MKMTEASAASGGMPAVLKIKVHKLAGTASGPAPAFTCKATSTATPAEWEWA